MKFHDPIKEILVLTAAAILLLLSGIGVAIAAAFGNEPNALIAAALMVLLSFFAGAGALYKILYELS